MKRKTKEQREARAKATLRQRIEDIAVGAAGYDFKAEDEFATADFLSRFVPALKIQFGLVADGVSNDYLWMPSNLGNYDSIDSTTDFLFRNDVRA